MGRQDKVPAEIAGSCVQCGNCCMNKRCVFLEPIDNDRYQCGIYHSPLRRWSNCGSFPLHAHDIARYACPSTTWSGWWDGAIEPRPGVQPSDGMVRPGSSAATK